MTFDDTTEAFLSLELPQLHQLQSADGGVEFMAIACRGSISPDDAHLPKQHFNTESTR